MGDAGESFGQMVKRRRTHRRWSQEMLGRHADGLDQATVSLVEHDKGRPTLDTVIRLASAFGEDQQEWIYLAGLMPRPPLPADAMPPSPQMPLPADADPPYDPAMLVAYVEAHPDPQFQQELASLKRDYPDGYARMCVSIYRAWTNSGHLAAAVVRETSG